MPSELAAFGQIAPHFTNPLVLIGLALLLFFGVRWEDTLATTGRRARSRRSHPVEHSSLARLSGYPGSVRLGMAAGDPSYRREGMATTYGNLGGIYKTRGDLDRAEEMLKRALAINEKPGLRGGMAIQYSNLGIIYETRGELDQAEEMYQKALALFKAVGAASRVKQVQAWLDSLRKPA